jgi:hypothetical protein
MLKKVKSFLDKLKGTPSEEKAGLVKEAVPVEENVSHVREPVKSILKAIEKRPNTFSVTSDSVEESSEEGKLKVRYINAVDRTTGLKVIIKHYIPCNGALKEHNILRSRNMESNQSFFTRNDLFILWKAFSDLEVKKTKVLNEQRRQEVIALYADS